jgi:hypothetical protein
MGQTSFFGRANALDIALAAFAAGAFGFAAFAMPEWRLNQLVLGSGLADVFAPARPPLGLKATLGIASLAALLAFAGSLALLLLADKAGPRKHSASRAGTGTGGQADAEGEADAAPQPIRLRRADAHPDAPMRRPLVAGRDLGEPPVEELVLGVEALEPHSETMHSMLIRQEPETVEMEPVIEDDGADDLEPLVWEPELARSSRRDAERAPAPAPEPETALRIEPEPEPETALSIEPEPEREVEFDPVAEPGSTVEDEVRPVREAELEPSAEIRSVPEPIAAPAAAATVRTPALPDILQGGPAPEASISTLMQRLESGLSRKERSAPLDPSAVAAPADAAVGHRLRSAINDLQKLAARS